MAGLTPIQAIEIVRGLKGLNIIGGDLVEVQYVTCNTGLICTDYRSILCTIKMG